MAKRLLEADFWLRAGLGLTVAAMMFYLPAAAAVGVGTGGSRHHKDAVAEPPASKPWLAASQPPTFTIPVEPLGFYPPGAYYQGQRESLVSLDFLDENRLLFTFRAPGLIHRSTSADEEERQIRAIVLSLPLGNVEAEAVWTLHDHARYLWMLKDGHFLLRDLDNLKQGNTQLEMKPLLHFPGPLLWLELDPDQQFLLTDSHEPAPAPAKPAEPSNANQDQAANTPDDSGQPDVVLRVLHRASGQVTLVTRVRNAVYLPINSTGYVETLRSTGRSWLLNLNYFTGGSKILGKLDSACTPPIDFISQRELLANACEMDGGRRMVAVSTDGRTLWDVPTVPNQVWPLFVMAPDGSLVARETLFVTHPIDAYSPLSFDDVLGQVVEVFDAATGKVVLKAPANPVLDGGGNVAISPSGKRVAVLDADGIRVYDLPFAASQKPPSTGAAATQ